ncbi:hypothetical protein, partial [Mycobacteroides abscessus]|uniref:hypothetical protein n=1 Tax=Mycobacteroides abscessus TaxID=36809 RepID=UPI001C26C15D
RWVPVRPSSWSQIGLTQPYGRLRLHPALVAKLDPAVALEVSPLRLLRRCHEGTPVGLTCTAG